MSHRLFTPIFLLLLGAASPVFAQEETAAEPALNPAQKFWDLVDQIGFLVYPLAALSFIALALILFYTFTIRRGAVVSNSFMQAADSLIRQGDYMGLLQVCNRQNECIARVTQKTLDFATKNPMASFAEVREVTEAEGSRQASLLNQRITYLADIGSIAPMVGLLGTVWGMIAAFSEIAAQGRSGVNPMALASGVSQALLTTAAGLMIAIPALIFYSLFRGKVQRLISELEAAATHLMALLGAQYKRAASQQRAPQQQQVPQPRQSQTPPSPNPPGSNF